MKPRTTSQAVLGIVGWLVLTFAVALFGAQFEPGEWYASLDKPSWTPPSWLFGPVWTLLYALMAVAAFLVWRQCGFTGARAALSLFIAQLVVNGLWSWFFFGMHRIGLAFFDIIVLWFLIAATIMAFYKLNKVAGWMLIPYLMWVSYAAGLNFALWRMN
ncbi:MAG: TspO/MBR family protein [candidate division Zixibacteria bacterium]|jgi:tryptophan-rich sensory protein|nr:TspO/MBR family protein [candidate division Zixibacteria bacterium]